MRKDYTGFNHYRLTAETFAHGSRNGTYWLCRCDCGKRKVIRIRSLVRGHTKSCGCIGTFHREPGVADFNRYYSEYQRSAKTNNRSFNLTKEEFKRITSSGCHYCGAKPAVRKTSMNLQLNGYYPCNGIDRIDSKIGYEISNCRSCCWPCNIAKHTMTATEYLSHCERVVNHNNGRCSFD